jgi:HAD superfamily hydrolase (TIGR01509 family)
LLQKRPESFSGRFFLKKRHADSWASHLAHFGTRPFDFPLASPSGNSTLFRAVPDHLPQSFTLQIPDRPFAAYIFDCDGTLADTMPTHYRAWCRALGTHAEQFSEALFYELGGMPTARIVEILNERHSLDLPVAETVAQKEAFFLELSPEIAAIEPVVAIAKELHGRKPMAVASGGHRRIVMNTLAALGIATLFDVVITAEDYREGKPSPEPFLEAARRLGVAPASCLVFEDTATGIAAATAAGMQSILVPAPSRVPLPK